MSNIPFSSMVGLLIVMDRVGSEGAEGSRERRWRGRSFSSAGWVSTVISKVVGWIAWIWRFFLKENVDENIKEKHTMVSFSIDLELAKDRL